MNHKIVRLAGVRSRTGLSRSGIYAAIKAGTFPRQLKLGPAGATRAAGWVESDIDAWIQNLIDADREGAMPRTQDQPKELLPPAPKAISLGGGKRNG